METSPRGRLGVFVETAQVAYTVSAGREPDTDLADPATYGMECFDSIMTARNFNGAIESFAVISKGSQ